MKRGRRYLHSILIVDGESVENGDVVESDDGGNNNNDIVQDAVNVSINCSACTGLIVNGVQTRTLRKVPADEGVYMVFPILYYVPLEKGFIDTLEFTINTSDGTLLSFDPVKGRVEMTLKLKRY